MKRFFSILFAASLLLGCASGSEQVNPLIEGYLKEHMPNPDTYKPVKSEIIQQGTIDAANVVNWHNIPDEGDVNVTIVRHEFSIVDNTGAPTDNAFIFYMSPEQDVIYYVHKDKGMLLFPLD